MIWVNLALAMIQAANNVMAWISREQAVQSGKDAEIAKAAVEILRKTETGKQIMAEVMGMTDAQVDATLKGLEP